MGYKVIESSDGSLIWINRSNPSGWCDECESEKPVVYGMGPGYCDPVTGADYTGGVISFCIDCMKMRDSTFAIDNFSQQQPTTLTFVR